MQQCPLGLLFSEVRVVSTPTSPHIWIEGYTMKDLIGLVALCTIWFGYIGLLHQWRKVWKSNLPPTIPRVMVWVYLGISFSYTAWGLVIDDRVLVASFLLGILIVPVLDLQFSTPRPRVRAILIRGGLTTGLTTVSLFLVANWRTELLPYREYFGLLASIFSVSNLVLVLPSQIYKLANEGSHGSSALYNGVNLFSFVAWFSYGLASDNVWLMITQSIGSVLQAIVFFMHFQRRK